MRIAVVIPTLNEAETLPRALESIRRQARVADRVVVVDGGSTDATVTVSRASGAEVLVAPGRGRGGQVAAGVAACDADVILVVHADMVLPAAAILTMESYLLGHPGCPGGCLGHRFDCSRRSLRAIELWDRCRAMRGHSNGDQAQFFRREMLDRAGGFPDLPLFEDVELARRLRRLGRPAYLDRPVTVSARRYERLGWPRVMWTNWQLRRAFRRDGATGCWALHRWYYANHLPSG